MLPEDNKRSSQPDMSRSSSVSRNTSNGINNKSLRCKSAVSRNSSTRASSRAQSRRTRVHSAPLLNSEARNKRLCAEMREKTPEERNAVMREKAFRLSRPQYLQFIKSSTGIIEEDYFADIFPDQDEKPTVR